MDGALSADKVKLKSLVRPSQLKMHLYGRRRENSEVRTQLTD
jgi:hypothetical protein